jgi:hypothetical protein
MKRILYKSREADSTITLLFISPNSVATRLSTRFTLLSEYLYLSLANFAIRFTNIQHNMECFVTTTLEGFEGHGNASTTLEQEVEICYYYISFTDEA